VFRYMLQGRERHMGLGSVKTISLAEARDMARTRRRQLLDRIDPIEAREAERAQVALAEAKDKVVTFKACAASCIAAKRRGWKSAKHAQQWRATLDTYAMPVLGDLAVRDIDTPLVLRVLEPIWEAKLETATRLRERLEAVFDYAKATKLRAGDNPAAWRGNLESALASPKEIRKLRPVAHHAALPHAEIHAFMQALREQPGVAARALEFTILTAARTSEAIGARREEIDVELAVWTVPAPRMKGGIEHQVPLSKQALAILRAQPEGEYIFPGMRPGTPLSNMALLALLRRMNRGDITVHGFRSTFRDWAAEQTNFQREVAEMALAHAVADKSESAYQRSKLLERRRPLMVQWARYCDTPAVKGGRVVPISKRQAGAEARS
jgi:integrase